MKKKPKSLRGKSDKNPGAQQGHIGKSLAQVEKLLPNHRNLINTGDENGVPPSEIAASHGFVEIRKILLDNGARHKESIAKRLNK